MLSLLLAALLLSSPTVERLAAKQDRPSHQDRPAHQNHEFHLSRLTVNLDTEHQRVELTLHSFIDDVELAVEQRSATGNVPTVVADSLRLTTPRELATADSLLTDYLLAHLALSVGGEPLPLRYLGKERSEDPYGLYVYLSAPLPDGAAPADGGAVALHSSLLCELHADQQNVVVWQRDGADAGYSLLTYDSRDASSGR